MPELPDIVVYIEALESRILGQTLEKVRLNGPFLLRTAVPPIDSVYGKTVQRIRRIGKRIALGFDDGLWLVIHLMIAGRLHWREQGAKLAGKNALAAFDFVNATLTLTEAGSKRRASLHVLAGEASLAALDPGGIDVLNAGLEQFDAVLRSANHTLKRSLTDPRLFSGIGNAYSDEILWEARLSPVKLTQKLTPDEAQRLHDATVATMTLWTDRLRADTNGGFPEKVTAFRTEMSVHGRYEQPCQRCQAPIQRIRYTDNETNYCANCQNGGKLLSDRGLARLLGSDWPKTLDALELLTNKRG